MSTFFSSLASKAQSAYEQSPLSAQVAQIQNKIQSHGGSGEQSANQAAQGGSKSQVLGTLTHQFRNLQMQYSTVIPSQRIVTAQKGVVLDYESISKDAKASSKELFMWGQTEGDDLKDVSDRLAYLNFVHGALSGTLSKGLDAARSHMKALRDAEKAIEPRRNIRSGLQTQIARLEHEQQRNAEKRIKELRDQLAKAEADDAAAEREIEILKRKALAESERAKWSALREYGEKLILLAEASAPIISVLPSIPPSSTHPYTGFETTAATRASLQQALDNYTPGSLTHSFQPSAADLNRSDSRSFGVTHASELSIITSPSLPTTSDPTGHRASTSESGFSPPLNPATLNNTPAPIPVKTPSNAATPLPDEPTSAPLNVAASPSVIASSSEEIKSAPLHIPEPTVAETGVPLSAGINGPGPSSGSLKDLRSSPASSKLPTVGEAAPSYSSAPGAGPTKLDSAEEEKARLQREERDRLIQSGPPPQKYETAEEEKKRLEKEEKERLLNESSSSQGGPSGKDNSDIDGSTPPPYQDF